MKKRVAILFGGVSVEHEVSVISGVQAYHAIDTRLFEPIPVYITKNGRWYTGDALTDVSRYVEGPKLLESCNEVSPRPIRGDWNLYPLASSFLKHSQPIPVDIYFPVFHGSFGEDGSIQGLFQMMDVPFVGCDVGSASLTMDKVAMKQALLGLQLPVVQSCWFSRFEFEESPQEVMAQVKAETGFPCILKPATLGSSVGIEVVKSEDEFFDAAGRVTSYCPKVLVEVFLHDMFELNCSVVGNDAYQKTSVLERPLSSGELLSFADKYERSGGGAKGKTGGGKGSSMASMDRVIPADVSEERTQEVQLLAKRVFRGLGCSGVSRIDFMVDRLTDKVYVNELNSIPGSLSFYLWEKTELPFEDLLTELIQLSLIRYREKQMTIYSYDTNLFALHAGSSRGGSKSKLGGKVAPSDR
ncbi:MAG: D-alanine--D-alanine ligase [Bdellovibrionales bacterium]|nr:D-alanine--D-alanine ligase [Bdellovibrionales bacterium]